MSGATNRVHGRVAGLLALTLLSGAGSARSTEPPQRYVLVLSGAPLARQVFTATTARAALSTPAAETERQELLKAQNDLKTVLGQHRIAVTGSVHILANAVFVTASPDRVAELGALPGVAAVIPMPALRRKLNKALSLVNASAAWTAAGGAANAMPLINANATTTQNVPNLPICALIPPFIEWGLSSLAWVHRVNRVFMVSAPVGR